MIFIKGTKVTKDVISTTDVNLCAYLSYAYPVIAMTISKKGEKVFSFGRTPEIESQFTAYQSGQLLDDMHDFLSRIEIIKERSKSIETSAILAISY